MSDPLKVVCGLVFHGDRVLATRRDLTRSFPHLWEFPGGKLEDGEDAATALHRELEEELRLEVEILKGLAPVAYRENGHHLSLIPFICRSRQLHAPVPLDHIEIRWVQRDHAHHLTWAPADIPLVMQLSTLDPISNP